MLKKGLRLLGKAILVITGVSFGVAKALDAFGPEPKRDDFGHNGTDVINDTVGTDPLNLDTVSKDSVSKVASTESPPGNTTVHFAEATNLRLNNLEERLRRIEARLEIRAGHADTAGSGEPGDLVTRAGLTAAMEQFSTTLIADIERRFDVQNRSVQSLRTMIVRTDELLEQVLESIESTGTPASRAR